MNIKEAKEQIRIAMKAYFTKDEYGNYRIPIEKQRPIFLMGPPGIGKTAIMEQVAQELGVGLVSYSMTHHTRQSALGLPFIEHKVYDGKEYAVSEYTMSEIIASVYEKIEETGLKEGILFLDEVNCVSETLAPSMLQFLQYKVFGRHRVPEGWLVVTAGNPPEYNNSVREFDIVTWDRLKRIDVEPDYNVWKEYAYARVTHPAIMTYLDIKKGDFYRIESTVDGKTFVTARGWSDLSDMIRLCEDIGEKVNEKLVRQYLQNKKIAKDFAVYYDLFNKYRSDYQVDKILDGTVDESIKNRAKNAKFHERLSLIGLLLDAIGADIRTTVDTFRMMKELTPTLTEMKARLTKSGGTASAILSQLADEKKKTLTAGKQSGVLSDEAQNIQNMLIKSLEEMSAAVSAESDTKKALAAVKADFNKRVAAMKSQGALTEKHINNLFAFAKEVFAGGQELLIIVTEMTINKHTVAYLSQYGNAEYFRQNKDLLLYERQIELTGAVDDLKLDDF